MTRQRRVRTTPSTITTYTAVLTIAAASVTAVALALGPAIIESSASGSAAQPFGSAADLTGRSAPAATVGADAVQAARMAAAARAAAARALAGRAEARAAAARAARARAARRAALLSGTPQQVAQALLPAYGWPVSQFGCLDALWTRESGWNPYAANPSSGAYGIPQALPGSKMASAGADWRTSAATQIRWGLGYIRATYGSPCGAWSHETAYGWY